MEQNTNVDVMTEVSNTRKYGDVIGICKWFNKTYGYGFIKVCDGEHKGVDIFVHFSGVNPLISNFKTLRRGEYIHFSVIEGDKGLQAVNVTGIYGGPLMVDIVYQSKYVPSDDDKFIKVMKKRGSSKPDPST